MTEHKRPETRRATETGASGTARESTLDEGAQTIELREEELVAHKELRDLGEIEVRTVIDEVPGRLEIDAYREEVAIEHEAVGQMVGEREKPREEDGVLIVPIYEEQLVVSKRLVLKERLRVRRVGTTERQLFEDTLRRERLVVEDPAHTGLVREQYPTHPAADGQDGVAPEKDHAPEGSEPEGGFFDNLVRKALD